MFSNKIDQIYSSVRSLIHNIQLIIYIKLNKLLVNSFGYLSSKMLVSPTIEESKPIDVNVLENKSVASCEVTMPGKFDYMVPTESGIGPIHLPLMDEHMCCI